MTYVDNRDFVEKVVSMRDILASSRIEPEAKNYTVLPVYDQLSGDTAYYFLRKHMVVRSYNGNAVNSLELAQQSDMVVAVVKDTYKFLKVRHDKPTAMRLMADYLQSI